MATMNQVRQAMHAQPFRPFLIHLRVIGFHEMGSAVGGLPEGNGTRSVPAT
jgi:hypothetical protein